MFAVRRSRDKRPYQLLDFGVIYEQRDSIIGTSMLLLAIWGQIDVQEVGG